MELIRITDQKLKIMLTPSDLTLYELNDAEATALRTPVALRRLLCEVRRQFGLDFDDTHISVEYFPSCSGGGEMFVSSMQQRGGEERKKANAKSAALSQISGKTVFSGFRWEGAYRFEEMRPLLAACHRLQPVDFMGESAVYRDGSAYYLLLRTYARAPFTIPDELTFLTEYGSMENASHLKTYIREHGELIRSPDAISVLGQLK